jgi:hypothetical protein
VDKEKVISDLYDAQGCALERRKGKWKNLKPYLYTAGIGKYSTKIPKK